MTEREKTILSACVSVMSDCFRAVAHTPENDDQIHLFILARDRAHEEILGTSIGSFAEEYRREKEIGSINLDDIYQK